MAGRRYNKCRLCHTIRHAGAWAPKRRDNPATEPGTARHGLATSAGSTCTHAHMTPCAGTSVHEAWHAHALACTAAHAGCLRANLPKTSPRK